MINFTKAGWEDYTYWIETDKKKLELINELIRDCLRNPFTGIGKPEPLKGDLAGFWSRGIDDTHRLVYKYNSGKLYVIRCRYHYTRNK
ncbi:MAG: Txe/YoeB family addiction module toxin [Bacteroidota bacterium]